MVIPIIQPPQLVAQLFPISETTLREYKSPSYVWPKGERKIQILYFVGALFKSNILVPPALPRYIQETLVSLKMIIILYDILCAHILEESQRGEGQMDPEDGLLKGRGRIQVISPLSILVHAIYNEKNHLVPEYSRVYISLYMCKYCQLNIQYCLYDIIHELY